MEEAPTPELLSEKIEAISQTLEIQQDKEIIKLNIKIEGETMLLKILQYEPLILSYSTKYNLNEIRSINQTFSLINSCSEFLDYLKALVANNKITIKKSEEHENYLSINFETEYLLKKISITIKLFPEKVNLESNMTYVFEQISTLKNSIKLYENEFKTNKEEKNKLTEENKSLIEINKNLENKI